MATFEDLTRALADLDYEAVPALAAELLAGGPESAREALAACQAGMDVVGQRYETGEYFVADLMLAGDLMAEAAALIKPLLAGDAGASIGKLVICTVKGDIHDIGKNIVKALLEAEGIEVFDLGTDVAPAAIVDCVRQTGAAVVALSGVLTLAIGPMKETVEALSEAGLGDTKVIIGGAPVTADYCRHVGADAWSINAPEGVRVCRGWLAG
jgi:methanogenic corrinoid protein MtbC1